MLKYLQAEINIQVSQNKEKGGKGQKSDEDMDKFCSSDRLSSHYVNKNNLMTVKEHLYVIHLPALKHTGE